jgi:SAM-dependent MidA family methyltransferase
MQALDKNKNQLPQPDTDSMAHSERVAAHIRGAIELAGGRIGFAEFMQHALYAPGLGYYNAGSTKFGEAGDFVTAPEISPLFAKIIARQSAGILSQIGDPGGRNVLEFGAGTGVLAVELIRSLEALGYLPSRYLILEVSADLRQRQSDAIRAALPHYIDKVEWLSELPASHTGVVIANEVLDALPVERFVKHEGSVLRKMVGVRGNDFVWSSEPAAEILQQAVLDIEMDLGQALPDGYESEVSLAAGDWLSNLATGLEQAFVFLFDYGVSHREYYAADRVEGWLRCHFRHHAHSNPLINAGIQDLTAWVDFSRIAEAASDNGLHVAGYVTQAMFMLHGGLQHELREITDMPTETQIELSRQVKLLTMPGEMGENFKCLGLVKGTIEPPELFTIADRAHTL